MKKLDDVTKLKLIYSGELVFFFLLFCVIGILEITLVLHISDTVLAIFKWITIFGSAYLIFDFIWSLVSKKRRVKVCLLDKICTIPLPFYIITLDILLFMNNQTVLENREYFIAPVLLYLAVVYLFQAIYHWFFPLKDLLDALNEEKEEKNEENNPIS